MVSWAEWVSHISKENNNLPMRPTWWYWSSSKWTSLTDILTIQPSDWLKKKYLCTIQGWHNVWTHKWSLIQQCFYHLTPPTTMPLHVISLKSLFQLLTLVPSQFHHLISLFLAGGLQIIPFFVLFCLFTSPPSSQKEKTKEINENWLLSHIWFRWPTFN